MRGAPAANDNNNNKQTGIDGKRLLSGLIAHHLEDLTVVVNERERRGAGCWQRASQQKRMLGEGEGECGEFDTEIWSNSFQSNRSSGCERNHFLIKISVRKSFRFISAELFASLFNLDVISAHSKGGIRPCV